MTTAALIAQQAEGLNRPIYLMLSGGMDSEVVAKGLIEAKVDFRVITFRYRNGLNGHEIRFVERFIKKHRLKHQFFDIDILRYIKSAEAANIMVASKAASFILLPHMALMNHIWFDLGGVPVLGNGDIYLENKNGWSYVELEYMLTWYRHAVSNGILGGIGFFQHTPEVALAMLREPKIELIGRNLDAYANRTYETSRFVKYAIYRKHWPDLEIRPKFTGNELVKQEFEDRGIELLDSDSPWIDKWVVGYDDFRSLLEPDESAFRFRAGLAPRQTAGQLKAGN